MGSRARPVNPERKTPAAQARAFYFSEGDGARTAQPPDRQSGTAPPQAPAATELARSAGPDQTKNETNSADAMAHAPLEVVAAIAN